MTNDVPADLADFVERCHAAIAQQVAGETAPYSALWSHADDVVLMGAFGIYSRGWGDAGAHLTAAAKSLDWADWTVEPVTTLVDGDLALTIEIERMSRSVPGESPTRTLRVTQAYRREEGRWRIVHRHADEVHEPAAAQ